MKGRYELIVCPNCTCHQVAKVEHLWPWDSHVHECKCGYIIMESEWNTINISKQ